MKTSAFRLPSLLLAAAFAATAAHAANPAACSPYTFVGRITDAHHVAFDATNSATLRAYSADNNLLAVETTFFREDSSRNYALQIPMASAPATGCAVMGDNVTVTATDPFGKVWGAVIDPAKIGFPGTVSEVDIVLAEVSNEYGIDDALYDELRAGWEDSNPDDPDADYDPSKVDTDGDGISDLQEALMGTDPFDAGDVLAIQTFSASPMAISFNAAGGRTYAVESSPSLSPDTAAWTPIPIATDPTAKSSSRTLYTIPSSAKATTHTLYLFPTSSPVFFRLAPQ